MTVNVNAYPVPTGGAIVLDFAQGSGTTPLSGAVTIARGAAGTGAFTTIWSGNAPDMYLFVDTNVGAPGPLPAGSSWQYQITDASGSLTTAPVAVASALTVIPQSDTEMLIRLLQGAVQCVTMPSVVTDRPSVTNAMPLTGLPPLPLIVVNDDLLQQKEIPIGQQFEKINPDLTVTVGGFAKYMWRVSILAKNHGSRNFWRDVILASFTSLLGTVFNPIGKNISHSWQAANWQTSSEPLRESPGFYGCDILLEVTGTFDVTYSTSYGVIENITTMATSDVDGEVVVSTLSPTTEP